MTASNRDAALAVRIASMLESALRDGDIGRASALAEMYERLARVMEIKERIW